MMNSTITNRNLLSLEKPTKKNKNHSNIELPHINNFFFSQTMKSNHQTKTHRYHSSHRKNKLINSYTSTEPSNNIGLIKVRKDIYGNTIEKGGNQRISFRDNFEGKPLVETTLINLKKNVIRKKSHKELKKDIIEREAKDKDTVICSSRVCNIF